MPRDIADFPSDPVVLRLPGQRSARVCPADDAGQTRLHVLDGEPLDRLLRLGWIDRSEHGAGMTIAEEFERSGIRARLCGRYDGTYIDRPARTDGLLEALAADELGAWRRTHKLLNLVPPRCRTQTQMVCCWSAAPWDLAGLRHGLTVLAAALRRPRSRP